MANRYAVIMAGGGGTRLWPLSRRDHPKHLLKLTGDETMYEKSINRLHGAFKPENILIVTIKEQAEALQKLTPQIPQENFVIESEPKGTASVIGLAAITIEKRDPDAVMVVLTADHLIENVDEFLRVIDTGCKAAEQGGLYTLGIRPTMPTTGYGYIEMGDEIDSSYGHPIHKVVKFKEKPEQKVAEEFVKSGTHLWNSGMFIWKASQILSEMKSLMPDLFTSLQEIKNAKDKLALNRTWSTIHAQTIDYGIMEKAQDIFVIPVNDLGWNDVGSWLSLFDFLSEDEQGNIKLGELVIWEHTKNSLVIENNPNKMVATIGLKDIIIVDTDRALLVCTKDQVQMVRDVVAVIKSSGNTDYL